MRKKSIRQISYSYLLLVSMLRYLASQLNTRTINPSLYLEKTTLDSIKSYIN